MAIYLIVAQPRHGKSQFVVKTADDLQTKNIEIQKKIDSGKFDPEKDIVRQIYSDIEGHSDKTDYVLPAPHDWRDVPDNSIIIMDEIHKRPEYCDDGKYSQNPMIVDLTTHGHHNKDIYLITQDPERLNKGIRKLVEKMYLVKRPIQKPPFATIYEFPRWLRDPWTALESTRNKVYQDEYKFLYKKKWQDMYTSASAHTSINFKIQSKFIYAIIAIGLLMFGAYSLFTKSGGDKLARTAVAGLSGQPVENKTLGEQIAQQQNKQNEKPTTNFDPSIECRKGVNVERPECVQWFNSLSKSNASISPNNGNNIQGVFYNPSKPFDDDAIRTSLTYEVMSKPVFSGCMKKGGKYIAYTEQGTILNEVSQADCKRLIHDNDRPYNYFKQQQENLTVQDTQKVKEAKEDDMTPEMIAKYQEAKIQGLI